jgi:protein TonB
VQRAVDIRALMGRAWVYPYEARRRRLQGTVLLDFVVDGRGRVVSAEVASSSGHNLLDQEARRQLMGFRGFGLPIGRYQGRVQFELTQ